MLARRVPVSIAKRTSVGDALYSEPQRKARAKMSPRERVKNKEALHKIHEKYYGKNGKPKDIRIALTDKANKILAERGPSRNDLMLRAKAKGIKMFRVMNKAELAEVLTAKPERIAEIQLQAKTRWQKGWDTRKAEKTQPEGKEQAKTPIVEGDAQKEGAI